MRKINSLIYCMETRRFPTAGNIMGYLSAWKRSTKIIDTDENVAEHNKDTNSWDAYFKSNSSGSKKFIPNGTAFTILDNDDNAWITNSSAQAHPSSVYKYNAFKTLSLSF